MREKVSYLFTCAKMHRHVVTGRMVLEATLPPRLVEDEFIDEKQLLQRVPISRRTLINWRKRGKLPFVSMPGRRVLFHWPSVCEALLRTQK